MDRRTLIAHEEQWVKEPTPTNAVLTSLHQDESELYRALVEDDFGSAIRLEQERIVFSAVEHALSQLPS